MSEPVRKLRGWQDILAAPAEVTAEVIGGALIVSPRPHPRHGAVQSVLSAQVTGPFHSGRGGPGGWWILIEPDVAFGPHDTVKADLYLRAGVPRYWLVDPQARILEAFEIQGGR